jgi:hypothetical protein
MSEVRDLVFFYNGVEMTDECVENIPAEFPLPATSFSESHRAQSSCADAPDISHAPSPPVPSF